MHFHVFRLIKNLSVNDKKCQHKKYYLQQYVHMYAFTLLVCMFRSFFKRSWSDGNILRESRSPTSTLNSNKGFPSGDFSNEPKGGSRMLSESTPDMAAPESELADSRCFVFLNYWSLY